MSVATSTNSAPPSSLSDIAQQFASGNPIISINPLGNGNINSTFLVQTNPIATAPQRFVLQRINAQVFRQPELVIQNMAVLTEHLKNNAAPAGRRWETPAIVTTQSGKNYWQDSAGEYWRAISFIENAQPVETIQNVEHAREIGYGLARFHHLISTLNTDRLADTLEGFHITPTYLATYERTKQQADLTSKTSSDIETKQRQHCLDFIAQRQEWAHVLENAKASGQLKLRPIHGDPKVNNILLSKNGQAVSLIDLDTLKPGLIH